MPSPVYTLLDLNNFWSPSGGGVRRYHLEKLNYFKNRPDIHYIFLQHDSRTYTERWNESTIIEHVKVPKFRGNWDYRFLFHPGPVVAMFKKYRPDVVEVGSPYLMPLWARWARWRTKSNASLISFWHADFPVTYVGRFFHRWHPTLSGLAETLAWGFARWVFKNFQGILVSSPRIAERVRKNGVGTILNAPLGVDCDLYNPDKKDEKLVEELKAGKNERLTVFFPHRFMEEKGVRTLLNAYPRICLALRAEPALVFAGTGPDLQSVRQATQKFEQIRYLGFISDAQEMARWNASCEIGLALSGWETFGLSILEAMASGQVLVGANTGAACEHVHGTGVDLLVSPGNEKDLVDAFLKLQDLELVELAKKSRNYAEKYSWKACFENLDAHYHSLIKEKVNLAGT